MFRAVPVIIFDNEQDAVNQSGIRTALVHLEWDENGFLRISAKGNPAYTELAQEDLLITANAVQRTAQLGRYRMLGVQLEMIARISMPIETGTSDISEYIAKKNENVGFDAVYLLTLVYAILLMVLINFTASYIVRAVIEEKANKLVEMLMVSVQPIALIVGKILASMCLVLIELAMLVCVVAIAWFARSRMLGMSAISALLAQSGLMQMFEGMEFVTAAVVLISILLAYFLFSLLAGLAGVRCSNMEKVESANMSVVMAVLFVYIVSISTTALPESAAVVLLLLPVVSAFIAPVRCFMTGNIGFGVLCTSWAVQVCCIAFLTIVCHRVYDILMMHRGAKVGWKDMIALIGSKGEEEA